MSTIETAAMALSRFLRWCCIGVLCTYCGLANSAPGVNAGMIDLSKEGRQGKFSVALDGKWEFFPGEMSSNDRFAEIQSTERRHFVQVPMVWRDSPICIPPDCGHGAGIYRLLIQPPVDVPHLSLVLKDVRSAYRLWVNRELVSAKGSMGPDQKLPHLFVVTVQIKNDGRPIELLLETANYFLPTGGIGSSVLLGDEESIETRQASKRFLALLAIGFLSACAWFNFCFLLYHKGTRISFYLGVFIIFCVGNFVACGASDWIIQAILPGLSLETLFHITFVCFSLTVPSCFSFLKATFPQEFEYRLHVALWVAFGLIAVVSLFLSVPRFLSFLPLIYIGTTLMAAFTYHRLLLARSRRREGANIILAGFTILLAISVNDMLYDLRVIRTEYLQIVGFLVFVATQEFWVIIKMSRSLTTVQTMTRRLRQKNMSLIAQIRERQRLESEIIKISEEERRSVSHDLHDGICQDLVAAQLFCSTLRDNAVSPVGYQKTVTPDASGILTDDQPSLPKKLDRLSELLETAVNRAYDLSRGLWPIEVDKSGRASFLEEFCRRTSAVHGIDIRLSNVFKCATCTNPHLPQLYRIAQEAINNAVRHAKSDLIQVEMDCVKYFPDLRLSIEDNGVGRKRCANTNGGLGMKIMAYRSQLIGGEFSVEDSHPSGTKICCVVRCDCHANILSRCFSES